MRPNEKTVPGNGAKISINAPLLKECDVLVIGAGVAGISAAVAAARNGMKTMLVDRDGCVGGTATTGLMVVFMGVSLNTIKGNCEYLIRRLEAAGGAYVAENTPFDPEIFKREAENWLLENGVELLFHANFAQTLIKENRVEGAVLGLKEGFRTVRCKVLIDTTGDADAAASAGAGMQLEDHLQPMTSIFRMDRVDTPKVIAYIEEHPEQFFRQRGQITWKIDHIPPFFTLGGFFDQIKEARQRGELDLPHDSIWLGPLPRKGQFFINATRVSGLNGSNSVDLTKAEIEARRQAWQIADFMTAHIPGFENARMLDIAVRVGVRETRKIRGQYILTSDDLREGKQFEDAVATYDFPMDIHGAKGKEETHSWGLIDKQYDIPYRVLLPIGIENLLVAGRCISVDTEAHGSTRSMPCCMATGEAAGVAAALAVKEGVAPSSIDYPSLRKLLQAQGVNLR